MSEWGKVNQCWKSGMVFLALLFMLIRVISSSAGKGLGMKYVIAFVFSVFLLVPSNLARASVLAKIDKSTQTMKVYVNGTLRYSWRVSTGRGRYRTPSGSFRPTLIKRRHYSSKYNNSPMPYSIFFLRGYAIHGTYATKYLGRRASHGCVRLHPSNAARLFTLVKQHGRGNTRITIKQ